MQFPHAAALYALCSWSMLTCGYGQTPDPFLVHTHVYKTVDTCTIELDVIESNNRLHGNAGGSLRPTVVHMHGGALINGRRQSIADVMLPALHRLVLEQDYVLVSIDYRLAPETKLPEILTDVEDAFRWVREQGPGRYRIDPERIAAVGSSAGGYLALVSGFRLDRRPRAVVSVSGYGAFGKWAVRPGRLELPPVTLRDALACVGRVPVSNGVEDRPCNARDFYIYGRQQGQGFWPRSVTGFDPLTSPGAYAAFSPARNVSTDYPPTLLLHGERDLDVPYVESVQMADRLSAHGVEHVLHVVPGTGHNINGITPARSAVVSQQMFDFLVEHLDPG